MEKNQVEAFSTAFAALGMKGGFNDDEQMQQQQVGDPKDAGIVEPQTSMPNAAKNVSPLTSHLSKLKLNPRTPRTPRRVMNTSSKHRSASTPSRVKCQLCSKVLSKSYISVHMKTIHKGEKIDKDED